MIRIEDKGSCVSDRVSVYMKCNVMLQWNETE